MIWLILAVTQGIFILLNLAFSWLIACFVDKAGNLPRWLSWCQTGDSNMFGADGDKTFRDENAHRLTTWLGRWWVCVKWIWRNTAHGFRHDVLGFAPGPDCKSFCLEEENDRYAWEIHIAANRPENLGQVLFFPITGWAWQFYFVWYWSDTKRARLNMGWKLWNLATREKCMIVFSPSPYVNR